jgi:hypothetical protein
MTVFILVSAAALGHSGMVPSSAAVTFGPARIDRASLTQLMSEEMTLT